MTVVAPKELSPNAERAAALVEDSLVMNGAEILRCGGPGKPRILIDPLEVSHDTIEDWRAAALDVVMSPLTTLDPDFHTGIFRAIAAWNSVIADHADVLMRIDRPSDLDLAVKLGKTGIILGVHHGEHFRCLDDIDMFFRYGQRWTLLASHAQNMIGSPMNDRHDAGLTLFGLRVIERMNRLGMAIDVSHCGDNTTLDAIEASAKPVLLSHANAYGICPNPRNKRDEAIKRMAEKGGVIGLMVIRMMVRDREPTSIEHYLDHVDYVARVAGPEFIGLGFEAPAEGWDSIPAENQVSLPQYMRNEGIQRGLDIPELSHTRRVYDIAEGLMRRGYSDEDIRGILGGNFKRALSLILNEAPNLPVPTKASAGLASR